MTRPMPDGVVTDPNPESTGDTETMMDPSPGPDQAPRRRRRLLLAGAIAVTAAGASVIVALALRGHGLPDGVAIDVAGERVTVADFERRLEVLEALYGVQPPSGEDAEHDRFRRDAAKSVAVSIMLDHEIASRGLEPATRAATDALGRYIEQQYPVGGRTAFVQALGDRGLSEGDVVAEIRRQLGIRQLFDDVVGKVEVTDSDVEHAYRDRHDELVVPQTRHLRHLVVATEGEARAALERIVGGEPFPDVARETSLDASTRAAGGDLGLLRADQLDPAFGEAAFAAPAGALFGPVHTELGWHVGAVEEIVPSRLPALDEIRDSLRDRLVLERSLERWRRFLRELLARTDVEYASDYRPSDPTAPPPVEVPDPLTTATTNPTGAGGAESTENP